MTSPIGLNPGNTSFTGVTDVSTFVHSGTYGLFAGPIDSEGYIQQDLSTVVGEQYTLSYWLRNAGGAPNLFEVFVGGALVGSQTLLSVGPFDYTLFSTTFVAADTSTSLAFGFVQNPSFWGLDDTQERRQPRPFPNPPR